MCDVDSWKFQGPRLVRDYYGMRKFAEEVVSILQL